MCAPARPAWCEEATTVAGLSAAQLFDLAEQLEGDNRAEDAERIYRALAGDPSLEIRNEARFRHAQLLTKRASFADAAALYREILSEQPEAPRVRIELAGVLAQMGLLSDARRELHAAQDGGVPPNVARAIDQFAAALRSARPYGGSVELALAPSNNINRATGATTLDTVLAPFQLSDDARATSGTGLRIGGQAYLRKAIAEHVRLTFRAAAQGDFYEQSNFNDVIGSAQFGLERAFTNTEVRAFLGRSYRWYGEELYATTNTVSFKVAHTLGAHAHGTLDLGIGEADYKLNDFQDGAIYSIGGLVEFASTPNEGYGLGISFERQGADDPGYATSSVQGQLLFWRPLGENSVFADLQASRLEADERLLLFAERRKDTQFSLTLGATLPQYEVYSFAPVLRLGYETNESTVGLYDYSRFSGSFGFSRVF